MEFLILNRQQISKISPNVPHIIISITEPANKFPKVKSILSRNPNFCGILRQSYTDEDNMDDAIRGKIDCFMFTDEQAFDIIKFVNFHIRKNNIECIMCQCDGGISRSSATASALCFYLNELDTLKKIFENKQFCPNRFVYNKILQEIDRKEEESSPGMG